MDKKLAIYSRTSTDRQEKGLEAQQRALHEYLKYKGVTDYLEFFDEGITGSMKKVRPGFDTLMEAVRRGQIHTVLVYSYSRFARSAVHLITTLDEFGKLNVAFVSLSENVDTTTPGGRLIFTIFAGLAQFERELIGERVKNGLKNAIAKGKILGRPLGVKKGSGGRPDDRIREERDKGLSVQAIAKLLGVTRASVYRALQSGNKTKPSMED